MVVRTGYEAFPVESKNARIGHDNGIIEQLFRVFSACNADLVAKRARPTEDFNFMSGGVLPQPFVAGLAVECEVDAEDFVDKLSKGIEDEPARKRFVTAMGKDKALLMGAAKSATTVKASWGKGKTK